MDRVATRKTRANGLPLDQRERTLLTEKTPYSRTVASCSLNPRSLSLFERRHKVPPAQVPIESLQKALERGKRMG